VPQVELIPAACNQQPILANLLELYIHDFSEFHPVHLDGTGRFGYPQLPLYWIEPDRHPFLTYVDTKIAGFALVKAIPEPTNHTSVWDMAEFFVLRTYRRQGIGAQAAHQVFRRFPGPWCIRVMHANRNAIAFWSRAIAAFTSLPVSPVILMSDQVAWWHFHFESKSNSNR
jgi:predicted acetyltransferase